MKLYVYVDGRYPSGYGITNNVSLSIADAPAEAEPGDSPYLQAVEVDGELQFSINTADRSQDRAAEEAAEAASQYKKDRQNAYPEIGDQLDALYKKLHLNDSTDWDAIVTKIEEVKATYPKP